MYIFSVFKRIHTVFPPYVPWPLVTVHKSMETFQGRKLFAEIRYGTYEVLHILTSFDHCGIPSIHLGYGISNWHQMLPLVANNVWKVELCYASLLILIFVEKSVLQQLRKTYFRILITTYFSIYSSVLLWGIYQCHEMHLTLLNSFLAEANC